MNRLRSRSRPRRLVPAAALAAIAAGTLAGCGSTKIRHVTTTITRSTASASSTTTSASSSDSTTTSSSTSTTTGSSQTSTRSAITGRPPAAVLAASARALQGAGGYAMRAALRQNGSRLAVALTTTGGQTFDAAITTGADVSEIINLAGGGSYLRGNTSFWQQGHAGSAAARARARQLAGHWLRVPARTRRSVVRSLGSLGPGTLARCLTEDHGTLRIAGRTTVAGRRALLVRDAGDAPGATPSTLAVAASGPPYPLRYTATGRTRTGGRVDACNDGKGGDAEGTISFDQFGSVPTIQPPQGAGDGSGSTT